MDEIRNNNWRNETDKTVHSIPVIEETIKLDKKVVETGKVRITKKVNEEEALVEAALLQEHVQVDRVPINQYIDAAPAIRYEGDVMVIPVVQEVVVIEKRLMLVEEIRVQKQQTETKVSETVTLRKEEVNIERTTTDFKSNDLT
ncbi:YsnF/AvaK domain-containing protein [Adhaeribacter swui]|uniref:YsnF/AvaK domain-containing protein n=1 Tax=Adhaeribacter swui TaxID=2086471 RepID=A0A7G7GCI4_9BACT|nr:YsnF/AvaK domain-containing protein [Adhaeribacter swui]QNF34868.1 YsnF/AvaK domain-containing protein [Adhaeribacter swui]